MEQSSPIVEPVMIIEGHDVRVFTSLEEALLNLEPIDIEDPLIGVFDSMGRRIVLEASSYTAPVVAIGLGDLHEGEVRDALAAHLDFRGCGTGDARDQQTIQELALRVIDCESSARH